MSDNVNDISKCTELSVDYGKNVSNAAIGVKEKQNDEASVASLEDKNNDNANHDNKLTENVNKKPEITKVESNKNVIDNDKEKHKEKEKEKEKNKRVQNNEKPNEEASNKDYVKHITYDSDGNAIYTDPKTKYQYKWCTKSNKWLAKQSNDNNPYENEHYRWCNETQKWLLKSQPTTNGQQQQQCLTETEHYKWDAEKKEWLLKPSVRRAYNLDSEQPIKFDIDADGQRIYTDRDGMVFFWDKEKNAWFPKIDDHFMAIYQMNYGYNTTDNNTKKELKDQNQNDKQKNVLVNVSKNEETKHELKKENSNEDNDKMGINADKDAQTGAIKRKMPEPPKWFDLDAAHNTKVYVSNLPLDITLEEFAELMGKCGLIMRDTQTQKYKIKLYTEADGQIKGDGLCDYIKVESVELALKILDEYNLRGHKIRVQRAKFQMRGEYNPALKPKRKKKDKEKLAKIKEKLFDWRPEKMRGERSKHEKVVIIKNLFHPEIFEKEVQLILEYQNDLREECCKCGQVRKVIIYDRHTEGVAQINMATAEEADLVIQMMHGRYFGKRQLTAEHWDGKTKYKIEETESEVQKRLNNWDEFLLSTEENKETIEKDEANTPADNNSRITKTIEESTVNIGQDNIAKQSYEKTMAAEEEDVEIDVEES